MRQRFEAYSHRCFGHRDGRMAQQTARMFEPQAPVIATGSLADDLRKQAQQLASRNADMFSQLRYADGLLRCTLKQLHCAGHGRVTDAAARDQLHALGPIARANPVMQAMLSDPVREFPPMVDRDGTEHHVDCCGTARTGETPDIDFKQSLCRHDLGEALAECFHHLPVHSGAVAIKEPGTRQQEASRVKRTQ